MTPVLLTRPAVLSNMAWRERIDSEMDNVGEMCSHWCQPICHHTEAEVK